MTFYTCSLERERPLSLGVFLFVAWRAPDRSQNYHTSIEGRYCFLKCPLVNPALHYADILWYFFLNFSPRFSLHT